MYMYVNYRSVLHTTRHTRLRTALSSPLQPHCPHTVSSLKVKLKVAAFIPTVVAAPHTVPQQPRFADLVWSDPRCPP